ncbi:MAG: formate/nitrite transporter family protein [Muribaculaceae bacterium]|nr:formate/nitrite transporter family protein [Muribaculaceae bacterium]
MSMRTPQEILQAATVSGSAKAAARKSRGFWPLMAGSALAGAYIALGGVLSIIIGFGFPEFSAANPGLQRLLSGMVFPIGLMLVVVLGADLFTGNNALLIPPMFRGQVRPGEVLLNWLLVWIGNFAGALLVAYFLVYLTGICSSGPYPAAIEGIAAAKTSASPWVVFLKGIGANWCVCLAVWLALGGKRLGEKLLACEIPVFAFVALGFEHCVANMFFIPLAMMQGFEISVSDLMLVNLLPATVGNILGGALFVGASQYYLYRNNG